MTTRFYSKIPVFVFLSGSSYFYRELEIFHSGPINHLFQQLKKMVRDLKSAESETKAANILLQFNDRFDEVLAAINSTEKRLDGGSKCKLRKCTLFFRLSKRGNTCNHNYSNHFASDVNCTVPFYG